MLPVAESRFGCSTGRRTSARTSARDQALGGWSDMRTRWDSGGRRRLLDLAGGRTGILIAGGCVLLAVAAVLIAVVRSSNGSTDAGDQRAAAGTSSSALSSASTARSEGTKTAKPASSTAHHSSTSATSASPTSASPTPASKVPSRANTTQPPPEGGYFTLQPVGTWSALPSDAACAGRVHRSTWEPRPDNARPNHVMPDATAVHRALAARPVSVGGSDDPRWDSWLLHRVDGQFTGTTDEIFQWAACKWGLPDNVLRAIAVRESTWYEYETYASGRPVLDWGMGDMMAPSTEGASVYCSGIAEYGRDYQHDFGTGICPRTFSIAGVMSWQAPSWGRMPENQNGTFPFTIRSTAFALDYLASQVRGCYNGWQYWLKDSGKYAAGDLWGCVGAWYAGDWHSSAANGYISRVRKELANVTWLQDDWPGVRPSCDQTYGCPIGGR
jgi:hypothetical protein